MLRAPRAVLLQVAVAVDPIETVLLVAMVVRVEVVLALQAQQLHLLELLTLVEVAEVRASAELGMGHSKVAMVDLGLSLFVMQWRHLHQHLEHPPQPQMALQFKFLTSMLAIPGQELQQLADQLL